MDGAYGCTVAVLTCGTGGVEVVSSGLRPYSDTIMSRGMLWAHVRLGGGGSGKGSEALFCTTHVGFVHAQVPLPQPHL